MSRGCFLLICWLSMFGGAFAQSAADPNEGFRVSKDGPSEYTASWWGRAGRSYFLQYSGDMVTWTYLPDLIVLGGAEVISFGFDLSGLAGTSGQARVFFRLKYTDIPTADPYFDDFDGDKVPNWAETEIGTDPLHFADSDMDGMPDDWETWYGLDPHNASDAALDFDGDGLSNLAEYQNGAAGTDPTDYYNGLFPTVQAISGNYQTSASGSFSPAPLVLELRRGTTLLTNAPITVFIPASSAGQLSLTNDGAGLAAAVSLRSGADGRVRVYYKHPSAIPAVPARRDIYATVGSTALIGHSTTSTYSHTSQEYYVYPAGTMGRNATEAIDTRIAGKNPATDKAVFSVQDHATPTYVRNISCWCYDLRQQMTCISPWNSQYHNQGAGTAITAQHIILSAHAEIAVGSTVRFITANNAVVDSIIRGKARHPLYSGSPNYYNDLTVYTLDSPLPASITPCKLLPANYASYLSYLDNARPPVLVLDQEEKALVTELRQLDNSAVFVKPGLHLDRLGFYEDLITGDSGDPAFLIINDTLVLLTTLTGGGPGGGTFVTPQISALNAMIVAADADTANHPGTPITTGLQVQTVDLSGFSTFIAP